SGRALLVAARRRRRAPVERPRASPRASELAGQRARAARRGRARGAARSARGAAATGAGAGTDKRAGEHAARQVPAGEGARARGGFGTLYRATRLADGTPAALKVLHEELATSKELVDRFRREAEIVGALQHPNICRLYETGELASGVPYMALELLDGRDLQSL